MKNLMRKSIVVAILLLAFIVKGNTVQPNFNVIVTGSKFINLTLLNADGATSIRFIDKYGKTLHKEVLKGINNSKKYDLSTLPEGNYIIELNANSKTIQYPVEVTNKNVTIKDGILKRKPLFLIEDNKVVVTRFSEKKQTMKIAVYDSNSNVIYADTLEGKLNVGKILNFSKLKDGYYKVVVKSDGKLFKKEIKKEKESLL